MRLLSPLLLCLGLASAMEPRTWVDNQDRKVEATLVGVKESVIVLRLQDGREVDFPIARLSAADAEYVKKNREEIKTAPAAETEDFNFDAPWPDRVSFKDDPEVEIVKEDKDAGSFIYASANFRYVCDVKLASSVVRGFARMFEATNQYCMALPLGFSGGRKIDGKYQILLFENEEDYIKEGGLPGSAGVFIGGKGIIMVPLTSLGVRLVGKTYILDRDKSSKTLPHEITHQLTPEPYYAPGSMGWFTEGIAEYVAVTPYTVGTYNVRMNLKAITEYVTAYGKDSRGGRNIGDEIHISSLKEFFLQDYEKFRSDPQRNYGISALLAYYFFHFDGDGDGKRIKAFLAALHEGKKGEAALEVLLDGRSYARLQQEIIDKWKRKGVDFTFGSSS